MKTIGIGWVAERAVKGAKCKQWSNRQMEEAMKAVQKGDIGINQAAREYGVP